MVILDEYIDLRS